MVEKHLNNLFVLLNKANKEGVYSLEEANAAIVAHSAITEALKLKSKPEIVKVRNKKNP